METVLVTSGFAAAVLTELRRHWHVVDIERQRDALEYLRGHPTIPAAVVIGRAFAGDAASDDDLDARAMLDEILRLDPDLPAIVSTKTTEPGMIVELTKRRAHDYLVEPQAAHGSAEWLDFAQRLVVSLARAVQFRALVRENRLLKTRPPGVLPGGFVEPASPRMRRAIALAERVAPTPATVLITGESGTGKELLARLIHDRSPNAPQPFTAINCGAVSDALLAGELFGHVRGAFTGAESTRVGLIQETGTGTLLLDEIGTISPAFQVLLLRVLEQRTARPVGGSREFPVACRFVAAANADLERLVRDGAFRADLWHRLNVVRIEVPPLRERREDVAPLAFHYLHALAEQYGRPAATLSPSAVELLESHDWPGNVRQLRNAIERAVILADDAGRLTPADFDVPPRAAAAAARPGRPYREAMATFERQLLSAALAQSPGNLTRVAAVLQLKRTTLNYRLRHLGLTRP